MAQMISLAAALNLALLGLVNASWDASPHTSILGPVTPGGRALGSDGTLERDANAVVVPAAEVRVSTPAWASAALPLPPVLRADIGPPDPAAVRPSSAPARPQMRSIQATGPLVARLADPTFRPEARPTDLLIPDPPSRLAGASDLLCIAVAIYHEARDQSLDGQLAVASVILNRTEEPDRWGATPCAVVVPVQFSFLSEDGSYPAIPKDEAWAIAVEMAREALERGPSPLVGEADHYHTPAVDPSWNEVMHQVVQIGDHIFFADPGLKG